MVRRLDDFSESVKRRGRMVEKRKKRTGRLGESYITTDSDWIRSVAEEVATVMQDMDWRDNLDSSYDTYDEAWSAYVDQIQAQLESDPQSVIDWLDDEEGSGVNDDLIRKVIKCFMKESKVRRTSGRRMIEDYDDEFEGGINGYAVQIHDYTKGYVHLLCYNDIEDAEYAEERLDALWNEAEDGNISNEEYTYELSDILTFADSYIEEIDFRRNIDSDNCYSDRRYGRWQIINEVPCPVYL